MQSSKRLAIAVAVASCTLFAFATTASAAPPANDSYANAVPLINNVAATGTNDESTLETDETGIYSGYTLNNSVWYSFTPSKTGTISFSSCSTFWINLVIVKGATLATSAPAATGPDSVAQSTNTACSGGTFTTNVAQFDVTAGVPLKIHLGSAIGGSTGTYSLTANYLPDIANDNFVDATELSDGVSVDGYNIDGHGTATEEASETPGGRGPTASKGVWYKINTVGSGKLNVSACAVAGFDGVVDVFTGSSVSSLSLLTWADSGSCDAINPVYFTASQEIYIRVSGYSGNTGGFVMNATFLEAAANDNFADAELVSGNNVSVNWDNANAGNEVGEPAPSNNGSTLWYKWTPTADGFATFSTCPTVLFDTVVGVFTGSSVNSLTPVVSADGGCDNGGSMTAVIAVASGTTYYAQVGGYNGVVGNSPLTIDYESVPANGTIATAQDLGSVTGVHITSDNRYADDAPEIGEPSFGASQRFKSVWFKWTAPVSTDVTFDACGPTSGSDGYIAVFSNSAAPAAPTPADLVALSGGSGSGDDNCDPVNGLGTQIRPVTAGQTYWIGVANYGSGAAGRDFNLNISFPPVSTLAPTIGPDANFVGNELSAEEGTWLGEGPITYAYQWDRCELSGGDCSAIGSANDPTYTLSASDKGYEVRVRVTGTGPGGHLRS